jgi:hypothetical protein
MKITRIETLICHARMRNWVFLAISALTTLTNDWQPGYIPPAHCFGYEIYQEVIAATAPGASEILIESISRRLQQ